LVELLPFLTELGVFDNSADALPGTPVSAPKCLLHFKDGALLHPDTIDELANTPSWAQAIVEQALARLVP